MGVKFSFSPPPCLPVPVPDLPRCHATVAPLHSLSEHIFHRRGAPSQPQSSHLSSTDVAYHFRNGTCVPLISISACRLTTLFHRGPNSPHHFLLTSGMSDQSGSSRLQVPLEAALKDYEDQTGIALAKHPSPLAAQLQNCHSVESFTAVLHEQTRAFAEFREVTK